MDPLLFVRLGQIRQQEFLDQAAWDREPHIALTHWWRLFDGLRTLVQRFAFRQSMPSQAALDQAACE